ncbi:MAG TPA: hypothetical protein VFY23_02430 [Candidatus Limnocylindrales bacterium]|nr:hypothetical protein [Candidatus Limnocylindrales bacterium]
MDTDQAGAGRPTAPDPEELRLLADQLSRMRGMLFGYSERFFERIRTYLVLTLALLVIAGAGIFPEAVYAVPFLVPFAFLETGYLFYYTVFARRHAEYLEQAINARFGRDVLVAHRLEAAYFYPPDAPKIAAMSLGNPLGMMSAVTLGYSLGAALLWLAGFSGTVVLVQGGAGPTVLGVDTSVLLPLVQLLWTIAIAGHLVYSFLARRDEKKLLAELERSYRPSTGPSR